MINIREKGKRGEKLWRDFCKAHGFMRVRRTSQYCGQTGEASDCVGLPNIHQEVKFVEALNIHKAMEQAVRDAEAEGKDNVPIVAHKRSRDEWLVTLRADDFLKIYGLSDYCEEE